MRWLLALLLLFCGMPACAADFRFEGFADLRLIAPPSSDHSWQDDGLGKLRYGKTSGAVQFGGATGQATVLLTSELMLSAVGRIDPSLSPGADLIEAYLRYRPVSLSRWRWSVKAGAFFAPFSLENTEIGWAPYWTITPSAINSWYGDELRTIGGEGTLEWRGEEGTIKLIGSAYGLNEPAGVLMAFRGWALGDQPAGLFEHPPLADATMLQFHRPTHATTPMFAQYDSHPGWYAGASWSAAEHWHVELFRYDNEADPSAHHDRDFGWRTKFWHLGLSGRMDEFTLLAQAVSGDTAVETAEDVYSTTDFDSAFALLGWERAEWRAALRIEEFHTKSFSNTGARPSMSENGRAATAALSWLPNDWLKLTAELIALQSFRGERSQIGLNPARTETQFQLTARVYLD